MREVWARYGETDPYFSVLTKERYQAARLAEADIEAFYATGFLDYDMLIAACRRHGIEPHYAGTVLDFGCGLARVGAHLSNHFAHYVGTDISRPHLDQAAAHFAALGPNKRDLSLAI